MDLLYTINPLSISARLLLSMFAGGLLGVERGRKNRPAGFRTYMLVCVGSALVMMTNQFVAETFDVSDPVRMGAQVISGIGFLGAGTIIMTGRQQVKGITTAACLWASACIGLAIGIGFYSGAIVGTIAIFIIMHVFQRVDAKFRQNSKTVEVYIETDMKDRFSRFMTYARRHHFEILDMDMNKGSYGDETILHVVMTLRSHVRRSHADMVEVLGEGPGILYIDEL